MTKKHVHKLKRHIYKNGEAIYFCIKDDCSFKINVNLSLGKTAECWRCNQPFSMTVQSKRHDKPHCEGCVKGKKNSSTKSKEITSNVSSTSESNISNLRARLSRITSVLSEPDDTDML